MRRAALDGLRLRNMSNRGRRGFEMRRRRASAGTDLPDLVFEQRQTIDDLFQRLVNSRQRRVGATVGGVLQLSYLGQIVGDGVGGLRNRRVRLSGAKDFLRGLVGGALGGLNGDRASIVKLMEQIADDPFER